MLVELPIKNDPLFKACIDSGGTIEVYTRYGEWRVVWLVDGVIHRTDGPAVIKHTGVCKWVVDGHTHRSFNSFFAAAMLTSEEETALYLKYKDDLDPDRLPHKLTNYNILC